MTIAPDVPSRHAIAALLAALALLSGAARAQDADAPPAALPEPDKSYVIPALEIIGFDFLLSRYNRAFSGVSDYDVSWASIKRNLRGPWVVDNDPFQVNQFAHPYQGSLYHGAGRAAGLNYWEAAALTFAGSAWWEITGEQTPPSRNDQVASGIAGSFLGEPLFRMAHLVLGDRGGLSPFWREVGATAISPPVGFNRWAFRGRFDDAFADHDPAYAGRLRLGTNHVVRDEVATSTELKRSDAELDFALDYGLPGKPGYSYDRPFDYFNFHVALSSASGMENLGTRGLLYGSDYAIGDRYRGIWGLYGSYDYLAPQLFRLSSTALSLGTTAQWWPASQVAVQGTVLAGFGYSAASTAHGVQNDRDYHYGMAPRLGVSMRVLAGDRATAEVSGQQYYLGRIANRSAGRDDVSRLDAALTWRVAGRHAIGVKLAWSHRSANYPVIGDRIQTLSTVGVYYTLLGPDGFGAADWRETAPAN